MAPHGTSDARYQGSWWAGLKQGLGKQMFSNGDVYEGLWRQGKPHGPGRYQFCDTSEYNGQW
jgi:1-phosphatidylinositol-4-phosphate 5-kinase